MTQMGFLPKHSLQQNGEREDKSFFFFLHPTQLHLKALQENFLQQIHRAHHIDIFEQKRNKSNLEQKTINNWAKRTERLVRVKWRNLK